MTARRKSRATLGFGFDRAQSPHHFALVQDRVTEAVGIEERFVYGEDADAGADGALAPRMKALLDGYRWSRIVTTVTEVFNTRLRTEDLATGVWTREALMAPHFGKELTLLFWAVEDSDSTLIPAMLANWRGLAPEERWWLYSTINATSSHPDHKQQGWRKAIKIAFAENPVTGLPSTLITEPTPFPKRRSTRKLSKKAVPETSQLPLL